jgi:acyl carrier protein
MNFHSLIFPFSDKSAQEVDSEKQFEQDFARMAFAALEDRATKLVPHTVAFELVKQEDDGARAVGMFGLKIDGKYYYIPAFFRNGRLLPLDEILDKKSNIIMPLSEAQIDKILGDESITLGKAVPADRTNDRNFERPSLDFIRRPKAFQKMAAAGCEPAADVLAWARAEAASALTHPAHSKIAGPIFARLAGHEIREGADPGDLQDFLAYAGCHATNSVLKTAAASPEFAAAIYSVYPSAADLPPKAYKRVKRAENDLRLVLAGAIPERLPEEKIAEVVRRGWTLWDRRAPEDQSEATEVDMEQCYSTPDKLGLYRVALAGGRMAPALVVPYRRGLAVVSEDGDLSFTADSDALVARTDSPKDAPDKLLLKASELKEDRTYVMAHPSARDGYAFRVEHVIDEDGRKVFQIYVRDWVQHTGSSAKNPNRSAYASADPTRLEPVDYPDKDFTRVHDGKVSTLLVPDDWRFVELDRAEREDRDARRAKDSTLSGCCGEIGRMPSDVSFAPGSMLTVSKSASEQGAHKLTLRYNGEWSVENLGRRTGPMNEKMAAIHLSRGYRLPPEQADALLAKARKEKVARALVVPKTALYPELREKRAQAQAVAPPSIARLISEQRGSPESDIKDEDDVSVFLDDLDRLELLKRIQQHYGVQLPMEGIDSLGTVGQLGQRVNGQKVAQAQINVPPMPESMGMGESGIPVQTDDVNFATSPTQSAPRETGRDPWFATVNPTVAEPGGGGGAEPGLPNDIQELAQQASEMGQRTLFDHATVGGLVRMYDLNGYLDQLRPKFKTALDGLGRVLFLLKWKRDDFEDRFGPQDTSEFTDLVRTVFRSFGDLILKLEERAPSDENNTDPLARA